MTVTPINQTRPASPVLQSTPAAPVSEPTAAPGVPQPGAARGRNTADVVLRAQDDRGFDGLPDTMDIINLRNSAKDGGTFADSSALRDLIGVAVKNNGGRPLDRLTVFGGSLTLGLTKSSVSDLAEHLRAGGLLRRGAELVLPRLIMNDASVLQDLQRVADANDIRITVASKYPGTFVTVEKGKPMNIGGIDTPTRSPGR